MLSRKSGVVSLHHLRGNVGVEEEGAGLKEKPRRGGARGFSGSPAYENLWRARDAHLGQA
jgi:hypothetical protein